jgi:predicted amidophosphoribosyltransferase
MKVAGRDGFADRFDWLADWLFPPRCRACETWLRGADAEYFCTSCRTAVQVITHPLCSVCGRPFPDASGEDHPCAACIIRAPYFSRARAWACYPREELEDLPLRKVVQKFKYGRKVSLGKPLGRLMALGCEVFLRECRADLIVPVPLHPRRLRWRGFNQSDRADRTKSAQECTRRLRRSSRTDGCGSKNLADRRCLHVRRYSERV